MLAPLSPAGPRSTFQDLLHGALLGGRVPPTMSGLGPDTVAAIEAIAREHPEATAELIADAYDAFTREHP